MPSAPSVEVRDRGYIIRTHRLSDTSLIVEWLTEQEGRVPTVARGALRKKSSLNGKLDLLFFAAISFRKKPRAELHHLQEVDLISTPKKIRRSLKRLNQVAYFIDLIRRTTETNTSIPEIFQHFHHAITIAENYTLGAEFVLWFEWRLLGILGLQPEAFDRSLTFAEQEQLMEWNDPTSVTDATIKRETSTSNIASFLGRAWLEQLGKCPTLRGELLSEPG